jgi:Flp pilus assembly protein CpaB
MKSKRVVVILFVLLLAFVILGFFINRMFPVPEATQVMRQLGVPT